MFPYPINTVSLFGSTVGVFTLLVGASIVVGVLVMDREMERLSFSGRETSKIALWLLLWGLYTSHFVALLAYNPHQLKNAAWVAYLDPLNGMSSTGGFLGAAAGFLLMKRWYRGRELEVADAAVWSLLVGWVIARLGCTLAFDHPGSLSNFILAFDHPEGGPRHNMGFYEMLYTLLVLVPAGWQLKRRRAPPGSLVAMACLLYAPARFLMDFLRAADTAQADLRYLGLTFAQYASAFLLLTGLWLLARIQAPETYVRAGSRA